MMKSLIFAGLKASSKAIFRPAFNYKFNMPAFMFCSDNIQNNNANSTPNLKSEDNKNATENSSRSNAPDSVKKG